MRLFHLILCQHFAFPPDFFVPGHELPQRSPRRDQRELLLHSVHPAGEGAHVVVAGGVEAGRLREDHVHLNVVEFFIVRYFKYLLLNFSLQHAFLPFPLHH